MFDTLSFQNSKLSKSKKNWCTESLICAPKYFY
uniref:Uncharacterized protein n=1 Tax=Caldicellulosiruptor owensensis TaxID=55205 RepID=A0A7C5V4S4_9FIRM